MYKDAPQSMFLNDYSSSYKLRLIKLNLLPLMYRVYELSDNVLFIKSYRYPSSHFNINDFIPSLYQLDPVQISNCNIRVIQQIPFIIFIL